MALAQTNLLSRGYSTVYTVPTQRIASCNVAIYANAKAKFKLATSATSVSPYTAPSPLSLYSAAASANAQFNGQSSSYQMGSSVAVSKDGTWAILGESGADNWNTNGGAVYFIQRVNGVWTLQQGPTRPETYRTTSTYWGASVAVNGDGTYFAIAYQSTSYQAIEIWYRNPSGTTVSHQQTLTTSGIYDGSTSGTPRRLSFSSDGSLLAVGCPASSGSDGRVVILSRSGTIWSERDVITNPSAGNAATFGNSVALQANGNRLIVGAPNDDTTTTNAGKVHVYTYSGASWSSEATFQATTPQSGQYFGWNVDISDDGSIAAIGTQYNEAYVFKRTGSSWAQDFYINQSSNGGYSVAISPDGKTFATGDFGWNSSSGWVALYRYDTTWESLVNYYGDGSNQAFGWSVSLGACVGGTFPSIASYTGSTSTPAYNGYKSAVLVSGAYSWSSSRGYSQTKETLEADKTTYNNRASARNAAQETDIITQLTSLKNKWLDSGELNDDETYERTGLVLNANEALIVELEENTDIVVQVRGYEQVA